MRMRSAAANEVAQDLVVLALVFDNLAQNLQTALIVQLFELAAVFGDIATIVEFETPHCHIGSAEAVGQRICFTAFVAAIFRLWSAKFLDALFPQLRMVLLGYSQIVQFLFAHWIPL